MKRQHQHLQPTLDGFERAGDSSATPNTDLVGRAFSDGASVVRVCAMSQANPAQVIVERECDGHRWSIHAGIVRLIIRPVSRRRAA